RFSRDWSSDVCSSDLLYQITCVGLQYGQLSPMLRRFSWKQGINHFTGPRTGFVITSQGNDLPDLPKRSPYTLKHGQPTPCQPSLLRHSIAVTVGIGILTDFPSTTPFGLALGADSPCPD